MFTQMSAEPFYLGLLAKGEPHHPVIIYHNFGIITEEGPPLKADPLLSLSTGEKGDRRR